ncbi:MAG TPA: DUF721 domain-containing protein [Firmicutes bacterium]|nr:DUF721 domain-containing protein [Bacillota bacterium]
MEGGSFLQRLGELITSLVDRLGLSTRLKEQSAVSLWPRVAGVQIASKTTGVTVKSGIMYVTLCNSAWAHQLSFLKQDLLKALNSYLGGNVIRDIRFGAGQPRKAAWQFDRISDPVEKAKPPAPEESDLKFAAEVTKAIPDEKLSTLLQRVIISGRKWRYGLDQTGKQIR